MDIQHTKHSIDYEKLATLLGINLKSFGVDKADLKESNDSKGKSRQSNQGPKWRRVEVLKELRALDADAFDHW